MVAFDYRQATEIRDAFARHGVRYLFIGKSGAILIGFPDTTQDADLFVEKSPANGAATVAALIELGFQLSEGQAEEIRRGKDFVQLKNGPFDVDLILPRTGSSSSRTPGAGESTSMGSPSAASKTLSPASVPRTE